MTFAAGAIMDVQARYDNCSSSATTANCPSIRPGYPNSNRYWTDLRQGTHVEVGVQCPETVLHPSSHVARKQASKLETAPVQLASSAQVPFIPQESETSPSEVRLSLEQHKVIQLVKSGENVFFTGPAGTGKSVLLRRAIALLKSTTCVAITAPTGIAGLNIGGSTIHSFAGIGLGKESAEKLAHKIKNSKRLHERWTTTKVLIIDEISMLDAILFDKLEYIARAVRHCPRPFGGIQLVLSGDFFQLPPVPDQSYNYRMPATYAFDATSWPRCISRPIFLSQVFRQKDNAFVDILTSMRTGLLTAKHIELLQRLSRPLRYADGIEPSQLFPLRREVESCNNNRLNALDGKEHIYYSMDSAGYDVENRPISNESANMLLDRLIAPLTVSLKVGAQVMLVQNIEQGVLVNGSVGKVVEFLTTHEALDRHIAVAMLPAPDPQTYAKTMELESPPSRPMTNKVFSHKEQWPMVRFTDGRELLCAPLAFSVVGFMGNIEAHRLQVPLILAWALSIHKSQGQTLSRVKVDLGQVFEKGQAYVALSRATNMENLELENFQPSKVMAHPRVLQWQAFWTAQNQDWSYDEMDSEEAISQFWGSICQ